MQRFTMMIPYFLLFAILPKFARCAIFNVTVGGPGVIQYNPEFINGAPGDTVRFIFKQKNHTVTQSSFQTPCQHLADGFDTGFIPVTDSMKDGSPVAELTITDESPIWVYCRQGNHCQQGMVFAINPGNDFDAFKSAATGRSSPLSSSTNSAASTTSATAATTTASSSVVVVTVTATVTTTQLPSTTSSQIPNTLPTSVDHRVIVGGPGLLAFEPSNIKANVGDTITFEFRQKNHTVTASSFNRPCEPLSTVNTLGVVGFDSGFMPVAETSTIFPTYTIQVNDTKPIWAYCRQGNHCGQGMVFAANAIEDGPNNFTAFQALAKQLNGTASTSTHPSNNGATLDVSITHVMFMSALGALAVGLLV